MAMRGFFVRLLAVAPTAEDTAPVAMPVSMTAAFLNLDGATGGLDVDIRALLGDDGDAAGGAEDADAPIFGKFVLGAHSRSV
jgi:hypothetical protein